MHVAHRSKDDRLEPLIRHLEETAELAADFAVPFQKQDFARQIGLAHDIGKYSKEFQKRILENGQRVDHSTAGAIEILPYGGPIASYCIAGHHGGLPDGGFRHNTADESTLFGRLKRKAGKELPNYSQYSNEVTFQKFEAPNIELTKGQEGFGVSFFIRMLFSCLVDADFLCTERFMSDGKVQRRQGYDSIEKLLESLEEYIRSWWNPKTVINKKRCEILQDCIDAGKMQKGIFALTVPTGGGKTVSSLAFALHHAQTHGMDRIIYVIPYTSIIEQNATVFRKIVGEDNVLEHHANLSYDSAENEDDSVKMEQKRHACENWDAPIIVTTNVQFFESLFSNKTSHCRKLHNISNSIIIFDEAQMIPLPYLQPCVKAISELVMNYNCSVVLCTATQPSLQKFFPEKITITEICKNTKTLFEVFKRTQIKHIGYLDDLTLAQHMREHRQVLCIVNSRMQANNVCELLKKEEGCFHLSTYMTPTHRSAVLGKIRQQLKDKKLCRVIATSLIEAGVDVDFPTVYRAQAGIDSEIQAAGRCNREGERNLEESEVLIFIPEQRYINHYPSTLKIPIGVENEIAGEYEDISSMEAITSYFNRLHIIKGNRLDEKQILRSLQEGAKQCSYPFRKIAADFKLIEEDTKMVLIPWGGAETKQDENVGLIVEQLRSGDFSRNLLRKAGKYSVSVYDHQFRELQMAGKLEMIDDQIGILDDEESYSDQTGLCVKIEKGVGIFL